MVLITFGKLTHYRWIVNQLLILSILILIVKQVAMNEIHRRIMILMIFQTLHAYKKFSNGVLSTTNPETFLNLLFRVSFFFGIYGLFAIFNVRLVYARVRDLFRY